MKRILPLLFVLAMTLVLAACSNTDETEPNISQSFLSEDREVSNETQSTEDSDSTQQMEDSNMNETKILVAYFSRPGENYSVGYIEKGNTHIVADMIAEQTGGDIFEIRTVTPYPDDYDECVEIAEQEQNENARPELDESVGDMKNYDVVFLGYPNWWGDMPMAVYTFLESYDFSGKTIVPFCTHEGSGLSSTESSIAEICSDAEVLEGLAIRGSVAQNSQEEAKEAVVSWLSEAGFLGGDSSSTER
ncbi:MAG: flavodoxin [Eubacteriales bacterium]|nr:flavodoxin [Eubacteriales bacterium]